MGWFKKEEPAVRFRCRREDFGVIAAPVPAKTYIPNWFRKLPAVTEAEISTVSTGLTVKRCMPFLDAMTTGWIIPLAATVRLEILDGGKTVNSGWDFDRTMVSNHGAHQVAGNPMGHMPPCKFHNYWTIATPPGWSCLFINPMNRPNGIFDLVSGIVDTDTYTSEIHFPFFVAGTEGLHVIEKGSPLVQVIPFKRDTSHLDADIGPESEREADMRISILRKTQAATGWYREFARARR